MISLLYVNSLYQTSHFFGGAAIKYGGAFVGNLLQGDILAQFQSLQQQIVATDTNEVPSRMAISTMAAYRGFSPDPGYSPASLMAAATVSLPSQIPCRCIFSSALRMERGAPSCLARSKIPIDPVTARALNFVGRVTVHQRDTGWMHIDKMSRFASSTRPTVLQSQSPLPQEAKITPDCSLHHRPDCDA